MSEEKEYIPKSAMTIQAHPDDQDFSVGGTLAKWSNVWMRNYIGGHYQRRLGFERSYQGWFL